MKPARNHPWRRDWRRQFIPKARVERVSGIDRPLPPIDQEGGYYDRQPVASRSEAEAAN